mmetsp:Transcript_21468/g.60435  ORF Transcript_21468/g.60435 Transcript_21468/m.60435 type:complete len:206 (-) Transcript_21468:462-1079(-)
MTRTPRQAARVTTDAPAVHVCITVTEPLGDRVPFARTSWEQPCASSGRGHTVTDAGGECAPWRAPLAVRLHPLWGSTVTDRPGDRVLWRTTSGEHVAFSRCSCEQTLPMCGRGGFSGVCGGEAAPDTALASGPGAGLCPPPGRGLLQPACGLLAPWSGRGLVLSSLPWTAGGLLMPEAGVEEVVFVEVPLGGWTICRASAAGRNV